MQRLHKNGNKIVEYHLALERTLNHHNAGNTVRKLSTYVRWQMVTRLIVVITV